ncbi:MAG: SIS domain-containing protein, partial [Candidatus Cloacimonetes bacterium]|nr:SIS domain-containing protein [Candidatus Cloacimonadota bacterium]
MSDFLELKEKFDSQDMYHKVIHLPEQIYFAYFNSNIHIGKNSFPLKNDFNRIVVLGMGGSAISGDLLKTLFGKTVSIEVVKDYNLPFIDSLTFVIAISYSGNTIETLTAFSEAFKLTNQAAFITSGGILKEKFGDSCSWIELKPDQPPRSAIGQIFFSLLKIIESTGLIEVQKKQTEATIANLMRKAGAVANAVETDYNLAKQAALAISGKIPVINATNPQFAVVANRWKCQINENSKYPAFFNTFSEMNHNEIEAWEEKKISNNFIPIFLSNLKEPLEYSTRISAFKNLLNDKKISYLEFF